jgi:hypothetical protein
MKDGKGAYDRRKFIGFSASLAVRVPEIEVGVSGFT